MNRRAQDNYDAFYVVRIIRPIPANLTKTDARGGVYLTDKARLGSLARARVFAQLEDAEAAVAHWAGRSRYEVQIQFCTREHPVNTPADSGQRALIDEIMQIPQPYRRTAYNWLRGLDVETLLLRDSRATYERHRRFLLDYDLDIGAKPRVQLITPKRKKIRLDNVPAASKNDPRHYFMPSQARPAPAKNAKYKKSAPPSDE